ncbi:MAG: [Fe-Fe] hydrogenase large subunit C-terminal domain-containing protein [Oscillospiraceae bacterium]
MAAALKKLGFCAVSETAQGAAYVTAQYHDLMVENKMKNIITTCCPSINRLIELYHPEVVEYKWPRWCLP